MQKTHVVMLLDESGSMGGHRSAVVDTFNSYVEELKGGTKRCFLSLFKFDSSFNNSEGILRKVFENRKVKECYPLTLSQYTPRGGTPLYDAMGKLIKHTKKRLPKDAKVLFVVHTDGQENTSHEYNQERVKTLIHRMEKKRGWTFVYLGEGAAAWNAGYDFGIQNVANFSSSMRGSSMGKLATATTAYACSDVTNTQTFYADANLTPDDIDTNEAPHVTSALDNTELGKALDKSIEEVFDNGTK